MFDRMTGNRNGNKMNMRIEVLEGILSSMETDGSSARVNSLRQVIRRNKADMADDATKSLDLMRRIFQNEITKELQQIMDRHIRTTFSPAIENLKRNGHVVDQDVINDLYLSILESAKVPFTKEVPHNNREGVLSERNLKRGYESDESDISILSHTSEAKQRRGRPRREKEPSIVDFSPLTLNETLQWNPDRHLWSSRFLPASKVAAMMAMPVTVFFSKYPRMFRYSCDEEDRNQLVEEKKLSRMTGRCYLVALDDVKEKMGRSSDLECSAFTLSENMLRKMRDRIAPIFERLKARLPTPSL